MVAATMIGENIEGDLHQHIGDLIGDPASNGLFHMIDQWKSAGSSLIKIVVALGVSILGMVRVMDQLQDALDCIWGLKSKRPASLSNGSLAASICVPLHPPGHCVHPS